jgi:hypothetical protein
MGTLNFPLQERVFVGHAHKRAEQALAVHAQQLTGELGACVADINALFARLDEAGRYCAATCTIQGPACHGVRSRHMISKADALHCCIERGQG